MTYVYTPPTLGEKIRAAAQVFIFSSKHGQQYAAWAAEADVLEGERANEAATAWSLAQELLVASDQVRRVRELATSWAALAPEDDWAEGGITDTYTADAGREILKALEVPDEEL